MLRQFIRPPRDIKRGVALELISEAGTQPKNSYFIAVIAAVC
jgi:hypothetical protein